MLLRNKILNSYLNVINESVNVEKCQHIAAEIGGVYDPDTNTIDCKGNYVNFRNWFLNKDGSFDFKLINLHPNLEEMFAGCSKLTHLPDHFTIPNGTVDCKSMFEETGLITLPDNFTIPNTVRNCTYMFWSCMQLVELPTHFNLPTGMLNLCIGMFKDCCKLTHLPECFTIPNGVTDCSWMFANCTSLTHLPEGFVIPDTVKDCSSLFSGCYDLIHLPEQFKIPPQTDHTDIFNCCFKLENDDEEFYQQWDI